MNWDDVRLFIVVADCKSVNKAAQVLKVTPGMVSRRLDDLESALDVRLFVRSATGMVLTSAGVDMLDRALSMQRFAASIEDSVRGRDHKNAGMVALRAPDDVTGYWIAPRLASFLDENPNVRVTLDCAALGAETSGEPDLLITANETDASVGDVITPLATLHYLFVAAPGYLEKFGVPQSLASAVTEHRTIRHVRQTSQRAAWGARTRALEKLAVSSIVTNSSTVVAAATVNGAGICAAPSAFCHLYPDLRVLGPDAGIPIRLWLVTRRQALETARVQRFADWLRRLFDTKLNPWFRDEFVAPSRFKEELEAIDSRLAPAPAPRQNPPRRKRKNESR
jgi:DNA-binding transcriptional LysR family regulator